MQETNGYLNVAIREQRPASEIVYSMCLYSSAGGEYRLINRRLSEANMYINGEYKAHNGSTSLNPENLRYIFLDGNGGEVSYAVYGYDANQASEINVSFTQIPTGKNADGKLFAYTLEGWYTEAGTKVEKLDGSLEKGQVLYAHWADPTGKIADVPKGQAEKLTVTITGEHISVRKGPATYYERAGYYEVGTAVPIVETYSVGGYTWGKSALGWFRLDFSDYEDKKAAKKEFPQEGTVTGDTVLLRSGPGTKYDKAGQKNKGERISVTQEAKGDGYRWGKLADGTWICLDYVVYDADVKTISDVTLAAAPHKKEYIQKNEQLRLEGAVLLVTYTDGTAIGLEPTYEMVSGYDNSALGEVTVKLTYEGKEVPFKVTIIKPTVTFLNYDGSVLSAKQYAYGETVTAPKMPERVSDDDYSYTFIGWDKLVRPCTGNAVYTAAYKRVRKTIPQRITSSVYTVQNKQIRKIAAGTKAETLLAGINERDYVAVYSGETQVSGATPLCTGMTVKLAHKDDTIQTYTVVVTGDINGDGGISITDALQVKTLLLKKETLSETGTAAADINGDKTVSITDFLQLKAKLLGKSEITPN